MKALLASLLLVLTVSLSATTARAAAPDAYLSGQDQRYQEQAIQNALEYNQTGQATAWDNPATGHKGKVVPVLTYSNWAGQSCRNFQKEFTIDGRLATGTGTRCRTGNGVWASAPAPPSDYDYPPPYYYEPYYGYYYPYPYPYYYRPYPYYYPFSFSFYYGWHGGHHHRYRGWRRHH